MVNDIQIVIDPGHGGSETGAVANGIKEKDITLAVSLELVKILKQYFKTINITREKDVYFDLTKRAAWVAARANEFKGRTICLSIHFNAFDGKARGCETIYSIHSTPELGKDLADSITTLGIPFRRVYTRKSTVNSNNDYYGIIRGSGKAQTVIVESLFIDNSEDVKILKQKGFYQNLADKICAGLRKYLKVPDLKAPINPTPTPTPPSSNEPTDKELADAIAFIKSKGIEIDAAYWNANAKKGIKVNPDYMATIIKRVLNKDKFEDAVGVLKDKGLISDPVYWITHCEGVQGDYAKILITRMANYLKGSV